MILKQIIEHFNSVAPFALQEDYDNAGIQVGEPDRNVRQATICLDVTEAVLEDALKTGSDLIISHHPLIFRGVKNITGSDMTGRILLRAIRENVAIVSVHTNLDNIPDGVNKVIAGRLGLKNTRILEPRRSGLKKLVTFCPPDHAAKLRGALFEAGAGHIGNYDSCSYNLQGTGSFRAGEGSHPYVGEIGNIHYEEETRIETVFPGHIRNTVLAALFRAHPYEEVAYDIYPLDNEFNQAGAGLTGTLDPEMDERDFMECLMKRFELKVIRHSPLLGRKIRKVALCGGSGAFLIRRAMNSGADVFITADVKYHEFFDAGNKMVIADIGHYESEQHTKALIYHLLKKKFPTFALRISEINTNAIHYYSHI